MAIQNYIEIMKKIIIATIFISIVLIAENAYSAIYTYDYSAFCDQVRIAEHGNYYKYLAVNIHSNAYKGEATISTSIGSQIHMVSRAIDEPQRFAIVKVMCTNDNKYHHIAAQMFTKNVTPWTEQILNFYEIASVSEEAIPQEEDNLLMAIAGLFSGLLIGWVLVTQT